MARRLPGQVMKDRVVGSADAASESCVRRAASTRLRKLLRMSEEPIRVNHRMTIWGD